MKTYLVFHIVGYKKWTQNQLGQSDMEDKVVLRLIDKTYDSALKRAKAIISRDNWLLAEVIEYQEDK